MTTARLGASSVIVFAVAGVSWFALEMAHAAGLTAVLLVADTLGWRIVSPMFNRERLITGTRG